MDLQILIMAPLSLVATSPLLLQIEILLVFKQGLEGWVLGFPLAGHLRHQIGLLIWVWQGEGFLSVLS